MTARIDITIRRGDNAPAVIWQLPLNLFGSRMVLLVQPPCGPIMMFSSDDGALTVDASEVSSTVRWAPSTEQTMQIPTGSGTRYELSRHMWGGESRTYAEGRVIATGGQMNAER